MLLSFDIFLEDDEGNPTEFPIFDAVLLSIAIGASSSPLCAPLCRSNRLTPRAPRPDLCNATVLCFLYNRKGKVDWHPATVRCPLARPRAPARTG